jgi:hypothetical protein
MLWMQLDRTRKEKRRRDGPCAVDAQVLRDGSNALHAITAGSLRINKARAIHQFPKRSNALERLTILKVRTPVWRQIGNRNPCRFDSPTVAVSRVKARPLVALDFKKKPSKARFCCSTRIAYARPGNQ